MGEYKKLCGKLDGSDVCVLDDTHVGHHEYASQSAKVEANEGLRRLLAIAESRSPDPKLTEAVALLREYCDERKRAGLIDCGDPFGRPCGHLHCRALRLLSSQAPVTRKVDSAARLIILDFYQETGGMLATGHHGYPLLAERIQAIRQRAETWLAARPTQEAPGAALQDSVTTAHGAGQAESKRGNPGDDATRARSASGTPSQVRREPGDLPKAPRCGRCGQPTSPCHPGIGYVPGTEPATTQEAKPRGTEPCARCGGTGCVSTVSVVICGDCNGTGRAAPLQESGTGTGELEFPSCPTCGGPDFRSIPATHSEP